MTTEKPTEANRRQTLWSVAAIILLGAGGAFGILKLLPETFLNTPYIIIVLLVAGFVSVTLLLYLGTIILRTAGLSSKGEALGMPEGSIRALIAMSLILIFAIIGVTVLYSGLGGETIVSKGVSAADVDRLENVQVIGMTLVQPAASTSPALFDVTARAELSQAGHDFGLQLLSTVSTLVVAVAGFYFGSRSVAQATKSSGEAAAAVLDAARRRDEPNRPSMDTEAGAAGAADEAAGAADEAAGAADEAAGAADEAAGAADEAGAAADDAEAAASDAESGVADDEAGAADDEAGVADDEAGAADDEAGAADTESAADDETAADDEGKAGPRRRKR